MLPWLDLSCRLLSLPTLQRADSMCMSLVICCGCGKIDTCHVARCIRSHTIRCSPDLRYIPTFTLLTLQYLFQGREISTNQITRSCWKRRHDISTVRICERRKCAKFNHCGKLETDNCLINNPTLCYEVCVNDTQFVIIDVL